MARSIVIALVPAVLALVACSGSDGGAAKPNPVGPGGTATGPEYVTQKGIITDFDNGKIVAGATITAGDKTATSDATGAYAVQVQKGVAFDMQVTAPNYVKLVEQGTLLTADYDRGKTSIVPADLANILDETLNGYDATLGVLSVAVIPTGSCESEAHTTISVSPAGSAKVKYFLNKLPSNTVNEVQHGEFPSAVIYNVQPDVPVTVTVTSPNCKQAPFPVVMNGITYEAQVQTEPGQVTAFQRLFLQ
jgi:hypothetical protein